VSISTVDHPSWRTVQKWIPIHCREYKHEEDKDIPSRRSGRAIGPAMATATRDKKATSVNCMSAVLKERVCISKAGRPATKIEKSSSRWRR
jgi:hypothetical protein